jgi:hypothetical protein
MTDTTSLPREIGPTADDWAFYGNPRPRRVAKPVRAANDNRLDADRVPALVQYRNEPDHPYEPLQSNWSVTPAGVVEIEETDGEDGPAVPLYNVELELEITPSTKQILKAMRGDWTWYEPDPEDPELGTPTESIGGLHFSNGEKRERMLKTGPDGKVATYLCKMPDGAMLGASEKVGAPKGGANQSSEQVTISNRNLTHLVMKRDDKGELLNPPPEPRKFITGGKVCRGKSLTAKESRVMIDEAIVNTKVMPAVTICPPGIASGTAKYSDQFIGMKPKASGKSGAIGWVDIYAAGKQREEWLATLDELDDGDKQALEAALSADNYAEVGEAVGQSSEYARRKGGRLVLVAANDNLAEIIQRVAA